MRIFFLVVLFSLGFQMEVVAQQSGDFVPGTSPPPGTGDCWDATQSMVVAVELHGDEDCDGFNYCVPLYVNCNRTAIASPNGCQFRKTVNSVLVGNCQPVEFNQCLACPSGSQIFCMTYEYFDAAIGGACIMPCGEYQVFFGGECTM